MRAAGGFRKAKPGPPNDARIGRGRTKKPPTTGVGQSPSPTRSGHTKLAGLVPLPKTGLGDLEEGIARLRDLDLSAPSAVMLTPRDAHLSSLGTEQLRPGRNGMLLVCGRLRAQLDRRSAMQVGLECRNARA